MNGSQQKQRRQKWFGAFGKRRARRTPGRRLMVEPMEGRVLMTADLGGNSFAAATELGTLSGTRQIADFVGNSDVNDFFRIRLAQPGNLRLTLDGLAADADLELLNSSGGRLASSTRGGTSSELIQQTLAPGTYVIRVYRFSGNTNYRLTMTATPNAPTVPDYAGNTLSAARNLGVISGTRSYTDFVGRTDPNDFYRFQVAGRSEFDLTLDQMTADADVELLNSSGALIARSARGGASAESIRQTLDAGTYFVRVYPFGSADTNYRLTLQVQSQAPPDGAGNTMNAARDLGTLRGSVTFQDFVGQADTADYYRFRVDAPSSFSLRMDGMSADADVRLLDSNGGVVASSTNGGANPEAIDRVLGTGTYFVFVNPFGGANTNYRLALNAAAQQQSPTITSLGGYTSAAAGVQNGLVNMSIGTAWNDYRAVNDQPGLYTWTINGTNFGTQRGEIRLAGQIVPVISWSNTSIRIDPSGAQFNAAQPWNWTPRNAALQITTAAGASVSQNVDIAPRSAAGCTGNAPGTSPAAGWKWG
jgi:hypothetical protein